jgi:hypothetical protein
MQRIKLVGAATVGALALSFTGLAGPAQADLADDLQLMAGNGAEAVDALVAGLQDAIDVSTTTNSAVATSAAIGDALVAAGTELVEGTEQFGALGFAFSVINGGVQTVLAPYLNAIDDPSTAGDVVTDLGEDLATILGQLRAGVDGLLHGDAFAGGVTQALAEAVRGNLIFGPGFDAIGAPATVGNVFNGVGVGLTALLAGTSLEAAVIPVAIVLLVAAIGGADSIQQLEDALAPVFEALVEVTEPVAVAIEGL